jgi:hypothetical protein
MLSLLSDHKTARQISVVSRCTFKPGIIPKAASKHAPDIRPCSRNSGLGASPNLPSGSEPMTLKYLVVQGYSSITRGIKMTVWERIKIYYANLRIITAISDFLDFEKSKMMSSAIFLAFPYGLIGSCRTTFISVLIQKNLWKFLPCMNKSLQSSFW